MLEFTGSGLTFLENAVKNTHGHDARPGRAHDRHRRQQGSENPRSPTCGSRASARRSIRVVDSAERGLTRMLKTWVRFNGRPTTASLHLNRDFRNIPMDENMAIGLMRMYRAGNLPQDVVDKAWSKGASCRAGSRPTISSG
jgi:hypothetical protein